MASSFDERLFKNTAFLSSVVDQCLLLRDVESLLELAAVLDGGKNISIIWAALERLGVKPYRPTNAAWAPGAGGRHRGRPCGRMTPPAAAAMRAKRAATIAAKK